MSAWIDRILKEFTVDLARLWIAADPDDVLLDERVLAGLRVRGFELLPFEDSVVFRAEYEERYRSAWDSGESGPAKALILHLRGTNVGELPWDYIRQARHVSVSLANLFPKLSYSVVRQIGPEHHEALYAAQNRHATQPLGESATHEFILTHIFKISPHLISRPEDLWRELLRLHYRDTALPSVLGNFVARVLSESDAFRPLPISDLFCSKSFLLKVVQDAWWRYLFDRGIVGARVSDRRSAALSASFEIPFDHPDVRVIVDSLFLEGFLHPVSVDGVPPNLPEWAKVGIVRDPHAHAKLVEEGTKGVHSSMPGTNSSYRDWLNAAKKYSEVLARFNSLETPRAQALQSSIADLQAAIDSALLDWLRHHYADLPSLPPAKGPVMVHHIPRFLAQRRVAGEEKIALIVFDGLAIDQWIKIRDALAEGLVNFEFDEGACFAWAPTLTSVSRQAIFAGLKPREFAETVESTATESSHWMRFWQDNGLRVHEVFYAKGIRRNDQLDELSNAITSKLPRMVGIVVDMVDEIAHGAALGKRGVVSQIATWIDTGFVDRLFGQLLQHGYHVYLTADHGNVDAIGQGRPTQGVAAEIRGERVRTYRSEALVAESHASHESTFRFDVPGLPANYFALFADGRTAFMPKGERAVVHGGVSIEELVVPFVKVRSLSPVA